MVSFLLRRLAAALVVLWLLLTLTFAVVHLAPGEPELLLTDDPRVPPAQRDRLRAELGLDQPLALRYARWLRAVALEGEWGLSFSHGRPVASIVGEAIPNTLRLALAALLVQYALGLWLGVSAALRPGSRRDHLIRVTSLLLYSLPVFWLGLMAILALSLHWPIFPPGHLRSVDADRLAALPRLFDALRHLALPALVLGVATAGAIARFSRNALLEVMGQDFIRTARSKGLRERRVVWVHGLRNAATPLLQVFGLSFPFLLSGSLVIEVVFSWPGMGRVAYDAMLARDYPIVLATTALSGVLVVLGNLLADLLHAAADPRVRVELER